jgi:cellulose synthase/poly-beta-1,6-N-acetylglucosamine synthase-like glycosyltransferase
MVILSVLAGLVATVLLLPTVSDVISLLRVALHRGAPPRPGGEPVPRLLMLVPAHNEELLIESCVRSLRLLAYPPTRFSVVVIADNCSDRTAELARAAGARCLERHDVEHPGKPHALAWALQQLPVREYDAVVIVDADTTVDPDFAASLATAAPLDTKAVQAFFDLRNPEESPLTRMAAVLATATHRFAYPLKQRAGLNVPLVGNGMCFGTRVLAEHGWHAFSICEDWEMYALLTERGVPIECVPTAHVYAQEAQSLRQSSSQRQRWTAGRLTVLARVGPRIVQSSRISVRQKIDALGELAVPGPALHLGTVVLVGAITAALQPPGAMLLLAALAGSLLRPVVYAITALAAQPDPARAARAFAFLPFYAVWRIGTAVQALRMVGDKPWIRTQRHAQDPGAR